MCIFPSQYQAGKVLKSVILVALIYVLVVVYLMFHLFITLLKSLFPDVSCVWGLWNLHSSQYGLIGSNTFMMYMDDKNTTLNKEQKVSFYRILKSMLIWEAFTFTFMQSWFFFSCKVNTICIYYLYFLAAVL